MVMCNTFPICVQHPTSKGSVKEGGQQQDDLMDRTLV